MFSAQQLRREGYLREQQIEGSFGCIVELTGTAFSWLARSRNSSNPSLLLTTNLELLETEKTKPTLTLLGAKVAKSDRYNLIAQCAVSMSIHLI